MSTLRRTARKVIVPGEPPTPAELPWVEYVADDTTLPGIPASRVKSIFPWAVTSGGTSVPASNVSTNVPVENGGGSLSDRGGYYTTTSYNGVSGTYVVQVKPDGSHLVIRV